MFVLGYVEFALQPQHETSSDSGIQLISDAPESNLSRKRPRNLSLLSVHSSDWNVCWETKTLQIMNNGIPDKRIKSKQYED